MDEDNEYRVPEEITEASSIAIYNLLPEKSKSRYLLTFKKFKDWMQTKNVNVITEEVLIAYFNELLNKYSASTLWSTYSMLKTTLFVYENVDVKTYKILVAVLKSKSKTYVPKQAHTFEHEDIIKFLNEAPDYIFLLVKMVVVMGIMGACRSCELVNMTINDIEDKKDTVIVKIPNTKNYKPRMFVISDSVTNNFNGLTIYRKYKALRPTSLKTDRFFVCYRGGRCTKQPVGVNTFAKFPKQIASYLNLENPHLYTGHSFRRSSATMLANAEADVLTLKRHGGWRSSTVAESYVENSIAHKKSIAKKIISGGCTSTSTNISNVRIDIEKVQENVIQVVTEKPASPQSDISNSNIKNAVFNNCTVSFHFNK